MGNDNTSNISYPAGYGQGIIAVGATDRNDIRSIWGTKGSNYGNHIDVTAPGTSIWSSLPYTNQYVSWNGTSMAAPFVTGVASLLLSYNPNLYNDDIENIIQLSADKVSGMSGQNFTTDYGYGRVNARKALNLLRAPVALTQVTTAGGTDYYKGPLTQMAIYGVSGLPTAVYVVYRHEVRKNITFPTNSFRKIWGRGAATVGWADNGNVNFGMGWCEAVPGTVTSSSATLHTNVYEVYTINGQFKGWYPTTPANATFAYTVLAVPTTISTNSTLDGNFVFDDNVTVNSGTTLTITPGSVISFASGKSMIVNGVLNANGTSSQPITFTSQSGTTPGSWGSITLDGSGASGSNLNYVNIEYGTGIQILNGANVIVQNSTIENNIYGIYFYNSAPQILNNYIRYNSQHAINGTTNGSSPKIYDNTITRTGTKNYAGILLTGTHGNIIHNDVSGFDVGMFFLGGSNPYFTRSTGTTPNPNNRIQLCNNGIEAAWGSNPILGNFEVIPTWGRSSVYNNSNTNIYARNYSYVVADLNWFGCENTNLHFDSTSEIYALFLLSSDPWGSSCGQQGAIIANNNGQIDETRVAQNQTTTTGSELRKGLRYKEEGNYSMAFQHFVSMYSSGKIPEIALSHIASLYEYAPELSIAEFLTSKKDVVSSHQPFIFNSLAKLQHRKNNVMLAKRLFDEVIQRFPASQEARDALLRKFYIALHEEKDKLTAQKLLTRLTSVYSGYDIEFAQQLFDNVYFTTDNSNQNISRENTTLSKSRTKDKTTRNDFSLARNYPNPFNPTTSIRYSIPKAGIVTLKVYDVIGREVMEVLNQFQEVGSYTVNLDASKLATGMYVYRIAIHSDKLETGSFSSVKKMMLLK